MPVDRPDAAAALDAFTATLSATGSVHALWVGGSWATGDHVAGVSDVDLVALVDGPVDPAGLHRGVPAAVQLGCTYVDASRLDDVGRPHPTYTHGVVVQRPLSAMVRCDLALHGYAVLGPSPQDLLPPVGPDDVRAAARAELTGYWRWAVRRPWLWTDLAMQDLTVATAQRARIARDRGELVSKAVALDSPGPVPAWLVERTRARRAGVPSRSRRGRGALVAHTVVSRMVRDASSH